MTTVAAALADVAKGRRTSPPPWCSRADQAGGCNSHSLANSPSARTCVHVHVYSDGQFYRRRSTCSNDEQRSSLSRLSIWPPGCKPCQAEASAKQKEINIASCDPADHNITANFRMRGVGLQDSRGGAMVVLAKLLREHGDANETGRQTHPLHSTHACTHARTIWLSRDGSSARKTSSHW
jgi:hypothetical protein